MPLADALQTRPSTITKQKLSTPAASKSETENCSGLREAVITAHNSEEVQKLLLASWAPKTQLNYNTYIKRWSEYCKNESITNPYKASYKQAMAFLSDMFYNKNEKYGTIAVARSALSAILPKINGVSFGKDQHVSRMLKGIFKLRPSLPKHVVTYDPDIILRYMCSLPQNRMLSLEILTKKLCTMLCLLSGQRSQSIGQLKLDKSAYSIETMTFYFDTILKTSRPGKHQQPLIFKAFKENENLCIINCLQEYRQRTDLVRENLEGNPQQLILSYAYPHKPINSQSIARYIKLFLGMCGIDITVFTTHSTRSASTSKANNIGLSIKDIQKAAGWSNESTFRKFYKLPIIKNFGRELINAYSQQNQLLL